MSYPGPDGYVDDAGNPADPLSDPTTPAAVQVWDEAPDSATVAELRDRIRDVAAAMEHGRPPTPSPWQERFGPDGCPFCRIAAGLAPAEMVREDHEHMVFVPHHPVVPGHVLVVPRRHVVHALDVPHVTGEVFAAAATYARDVGSCNLITSVDAPATQTVRHLHVHVIPRKPWDGLQLPWTGRPPL